MKHCWFAVCLLFGVWDGRRPHVERPQNSCHTDANMPTCYNMYASKSTMYGRISTGYLLRKVYCCVSVFFSGVRDTPVYLCRIIHLIYIYALFIGGTAVLLAEVTSRRWPRRHELPRKNYVPYSVVYDSRIYYPIIYSTFRVFCRLVPEDTNEIRL